MNISSRAGLKTLLLACALLVGVYLTACNQTAAPGPTATATPRNPQVEATTFTPAAPPAMTPTPTAIQATPTQTPTEAPASPTPENPTATPETPASPTPENTPTQAPPGESSQADCIDKAAYFSDVTIPDGTSFKQSVTFTKTWQIRNEGTCTWDGYHLVFASGDIMDGALSNPMPVVKPGEIADVSVDLKSPPQGGEYTGFWEFENTSGQRFGVNSHGKDFIWVKIGVSWFTADNPPGVPKPTPGPGGASQPAGCTVEQNADYEAQILTLINQARAEKSLPALTLRDPLTAAARNHSRDMACNDFIDHTGSDGSTWFTRIQAQKYAYSYASENIYVGDPDFGGDAQGAFDWWMNSQVHRDNILSPKVTSIGIGYAYYSGSTYKGYYTVDFARP